jgi:hypothetical protein
MRQSIWCSLRNALRSDGSRGIDTDWTWEPSRLRAPGLVDSGRAFAFGNQRLGAACYESDE